MSHNASGINTFHIRLFLNFTKCVERLSNFKTFFENVCEMCWNKYKQIGDYFRNTCGRKVEIREKESVLDRHDHHDHPKQGPCRSYPRHKRHTIFDNMLNPKTEGTALRILVAFSKISPSKNALINWTAIFVAA